MFSSTSVAEVGEFLGVDILLFFVLAAFSVAVSQNVAEMASEVRSSWRSS